MAAVCRRLKENMLENSVGYARSEVSLLERILRFNCYMK